MTRRGVSRRSVLKGLGAAVALPLFDSGWPNRVVAAEAVAHTPRRVAFLYVPNGVNMAHWRPEQTGTGYTLPSILEPLASFREDMLVLSGLTCDKARPNGDGAGDHARSLSAFLTASQARKTHGADIFVGTSIDQVAAERVGTQTRFSSLEIGCEPARQSGDCDSGYSCAYSSSMAWKSPTQPLGKEIDPRQGFERLFGSGESGASAERKQDRQSVLDYVQGDANRLRGRLGTTDRRKLDEYLTAIRELELRISRHEDRAKEFKPNFEQPTGIPDNYGEHIRLMGDLMVLAFQSDSTRICTFVFANEGSNRDYRLIDVPEGHHDLSHHGSEAAKLEKIRKINHFHTTQLAYILEKLKATPDGDGNLLDNSMIVYGSGIGDGNRHNHDDLPILLAGRGGGTITPGRHIEFSDETPLANLYLSMLDRIDAAVDHHGDSTGRLGELEV
ncbi:MAG: DUF1552 domain-containing protein [Planctomycetia bacterium]|nr:DUF1552 domain-containing protein [Planctomycetia bacterium]